MDRLLPYSQILDKHSTLSYPAVSDGEKRLITMTPGWDVVDESVAREKESFNIKRGRTIYL
jgi:hypothetical protein